MRGAAPTDDSGAKHSTARRQTPQAIGSVVKYSLDSSICFAKNESRKNNTRGNPGYVDRRTRKSRPDRTGTQRTRTIFRRKHGEE